MRSPRPFVWSLVLGSVLSPAWAQAPRLQFLDRVKDDTTLSGAITLKVSRDPILRPRGIKVAIEVDGVIQETLETLPVTTSWDSSDAPDGKHVIRLVLLNAISHETGTVDELRIRTLNRANPAPLRPHEEVKTTPRQEPVREERTREDRSRTTRKDPDREPARGRITDHLGPDSPSVVSVTASETDAVVSRAANALEFSACSLQVESGKLLIGRKDSSLTVFDPASRDGWSVNSPLPAGEVLAAARSGDTACWICTEGGTERVTPFTPARWLFVYREKERKVLSFDLAGAPAPARRVALWRGNVLLTGSTGGTEVDLKTGAFRGIEAILPDEGSASLRGADVSIVTSTRRALLVAFGRGARSGAVRGPSVAAGELVAWASDGERWSALELPSLSEAGVETIRQVSITPDRIGLATNGGVAGVSVSINRGDVQRAEYPRSDQTGRSVSQISLSGRHLWCVRGTSLFHADLEAGKQDAFLPWNTSGLSPQVIAADGETLWIGTNRGIKHLELSHSDPETGYAGYVRARIGSPEDISSEALPRLAQEIDSWQGTPYLWGGETRNGVDCSGFVMKAFQSIGVRLDHGSDYLRSCRQGAIVRDELRYGDVLVFPGHCAIYTGDGTTAETIDKAVGRATIWRRNEVVVRRFAGASAVDTHTFASRSGGYGKQGRRKSAQGQKPPSR